MYFSLRVKINTKKIYIPRKNNRHTGSSKYCATRSFRSSLTPGHPVLGSCPHSFLRARVARVAAAQLTAAAAHVSKGGTKGFIICSSQPPDKSIPPSPPARRQAGEPCQTWPLAWRAAEGTVPRLRDLSPPACSLPYRDPLQRLLIYDPVSTHDLTGSSRCSST